MKLRNCEVEKKMQYDYLIEIIIWYANMLMLVSLRRDKNDVVYSFPVTAPNLPKKKEQRKKKKGGWIYQ